MAAIPKGNSGETVTVGCKLPHGLILRIFNMIEVDEPVMGGGSRKVPTARERAERVTINGCAHMQNKAPNAPISSGFALTHGVNKDFWDLWLTQNKDSDMVRNGLIFAQGKPADTEAEAKEKELVRSGLERLDPEKLPGKLQTARSV